MSIYGNPVMLGGSGGGGGTVNWRENFLINWDFANPVNTRGQTQYRSSSMSYSLNGWQLQGGQLDIVSGGIKLSRYTAGTQGYFMQRFKQVPTTAFGTYTLIFSAIVDGVLGSFSPSSLPGAGGKGSVNISGITLRFYNYGTEVACTIDIGAEAGDHLIQAVKLETGSVQSLATNSGGVLTLNNTMDANTEKIKIAAGWVYDA